MELFEDKKITLMGLGLLGRGVGDAVFLAKAGAILTVTDLKTEEELASSIRQLKKFKNVRFVLGRHELEDFRTADMVIKAAGVPLDSPFILEALKNNVPVNMSTALFAESTTARTIGITGTRGKSTVTDMICEILKSLQDSKGKTAAKVFAGGNVRGLSTLALSPAVGPADVVVLELDSWQLQGFAGIHRSSLEISQGFSPHIAVFTTFMPDHLNYYGGNMERYFADKAHIYRFQTKNDFLIVSPQVANFIKKYGPKPKSKMIIVRATDLPADLQLKIPGKHNRLNAALALAAVQAFLAPSGDSVGLDGDSGGGLLGEKNGAVRYILESYKGLAGRLEFVKKYKGIEIYNDTNSTTPDATLAALQAFDSGQQNSTVLIYGGADKKLDSEFLLKVLPEYVKAIVVLPGSGTELVRKKLLAIGSKSEGRIPVVFVENMKEAMKQGLALAKSGDRLLMSPGLASFGLFKNEYDRGDQFNAIVKKLR